MNSKKNNRSSLTNLRKSSPNILEDNAIHSECEASDDMQSVVETATECTQAAQSVAEPEPVYSSQHIDCAKVLAEFTTQISYMVVETKGRQFFGTPF